MGGASDEFLESGIPVTLLEVKREALEKGIATIRKNYEASAKKGSSPRDSRERRRCSSELLTMI